MVVRYNVSRRTFMVAAAASAIPTAGFAADPLKFGVVLPLTGPSAFYGADQVKAISWAVEDVNKAGGVGGRPLQMVAVDSQADPQVGIAAVNRLASVEKAPAYVVSWSGVVRATAVVANREKILELSSGATSPNIAKLGEFVYTIFPLADVEAVSAAKWQIAHLKKSKAAVVYVNNEGGIDGAKDYRDAFVAAGGKVVAFEAYDPKQTDFSGMLLRVQSSQPDIIWVQGDVADIPLVVGQIRQLGLKQTIATTSSGQNMRIVQQLGAAAEGLLVTSLAPGSDVNPNVATFIARWEKDEKRTPNGLPFTQYMYDSVYVFRDLFKHTIDKQRSVTGENLRLAMTEIPSFDLPMTGLLKIISEKGEHRVKKPVYILEVKGGKYTPFATIGVD
jgi:branched-chain amino acid transport system substrate-binding protein